MEKKEALAVVALMQANWAHIEVNELSLAVWCEHLRDIPSEAGVTVAHTLIATSEHFPTVLSFRDVWRALLRKERDWDRPLSLNAPVAPPELGIAGVALARVALEDAAEMKVRLPSEVEERRTPKPTLSQDPDYRCYLDEHEECGPPMWDPLRWSGDEDE